MNPNIFLITLLATVATSSSSIAEVCSEFKGSTMNVEGVTQNTWRVDFPSQPDVVVDEPWKETDFEIDPRGYMQSVLATASHEFRRTGPRLVGTGSEPWWIVPWMDYTEFGREPLMGLTKERGPDPGDLSPSSTGSHQVWAIGFYNAPGAATVGGIFKNPCDPVYPANVRFPGGTVSVKFLFTDAPVSELEYLTGAPIYHAYLDVPDQQGTTADRERREVRLLQVDIAVRDNRADPVGWVFGTFAWIGSKRGDAVFDNLEPVSLQWGDDPGVLHPRDIRQSWINPMLEGVLFGWPERPTLGFHGRANGPADNIRSSCLSCHASSRLPSVHGMRLLNSSFKMVIDLADQDKVATHVSDWFINLPAGDLFKPDVPAVSALDYSLQLDAAAFRMCAACREGALHGPTPSVCKATKWFEDPQCSDPFQVKSLAVEDADTDLLQFLRESEQQPPRQ